MEYQIKNIFIQKSCKNVQQKLVPDFFLIWEVNQNSHCMQEINLEVKYFETGLSKSLKKGNFIFSFQLSPFQ